MGNNSFRGIVFKYAHYKKILLPLNAIVYHLLYLNPFRKNYLWVFGAWEGKKYDDNSKYLFEYVNKRYGNLIHSVWLTKSNKQVEIIRSLGYEAYKCGSIKGMKYALSAGCAIYTNGLQDFGMIPLVGGAKVVALWHGNSFKRVYNNNYTGIKRNLKDALDYFFCWTYRNVSIVTCEYSKRQHIGQFNIKDENSVYIAGQPRNDALKIHYSKTEILGPEYEGKKLILYMPTYRHKAQSEDTIERIIRGLNENERLNKFLQDNNTLFLIKLHPLTTPFSLMLNDSFKMLGYRQIKSNQPLLTITDYLITDYSGGFIDYSLLLKPVVFYTPDEDEFLKYSERMEKEFFELSALYKAKTPDDLVELLKKPSTIVAEKTNEIFEDQTISGTCYSENVCKIIFNELRIQF